MSATVAQIHDAFFLVRDADVRSGKSKSSTADWYRFGLASVLNTTIPEVVPSWGGRLIREMPAAELNELHLAGHTFTNHTARSLKCLYRWAADQNLIPKNQFAKLQAPPCGERERTLEPSELVRLYRCSPRKLRRFFFLMRHTIARPGEVRQLTWGAIDFEKRHVTYGDFKAKKKRKDKARFRVIALDMRALRLLVAWHRRLGSPSSETPLFPDRDGKMWSANAVRCAMRAARAKAGLVSDDDDEKIVCYTLRHTGGTMAITNGVPLKIVSELMGHTSTRTTERYVHVKSEHLVAAIDAATSRPRPGHAGR